MEKELLKNIKKRPATVLYPYEKTPIVKDMRAMVTWNIESCIGCGLCPKVCPSAAIKMFGNKKEAEITYLLDRCIFCGECVDICPTKAIEVTTEYELAFTSRSDMTIFFERPSNKSRKKRRQMRTT